MSDRSNLSNEAESLVRQIKEALDNERDFSARTEDYSIEVSRFSEKKLEGDFTGHTPAGIWLIRALDAKLMASGFDVSRIRLIG